MTFEEFGVICCIHPDTPTSKGSVSSPSRKEPSQIASKETFEERVVIWKAFKTIIKVIKKKTPPPPQKKLLWHSVTMDVEKVHVKVGKKEEKKQPAKQRKARKIAKSADPTAFKPASLLKKSPEIETLAMRIMREYKSLEHARKIATTIEAEKKSKCQEQDLMWAKLCESFKLTSIKTKIYNEAIREEVMEKMPAEELYMDCLMRQVGNVFMANVTALHKASLFKKFDSDDPLVLYTSQRQLTTDIMPKTVDVYMSLSNAVDNNLIPSNIHWVNLVEAEDPRFANCKAVCYGIFHSFTYKQNFVAAYYDCPLESQAGNFACKWICFERFIERKNNVIKL